MKMFLFSFIQLFDMLYSRQLCARFIQDSSAPALFKTALRPLYSRQLSARFIQDSSAPALFKTVLRPLYSRQLCARFSQDNSAPKGEHQSPPLLATHQTKIRYCKPLIRKIKIE